LEAESETEARYLMENDPAVKNGIMTAELHPYRIALMRTLANGVGPAER